MANIQRYNNETGLEGVLDSFFDNWGVKTTRIPPVDIEENDAAYIIKAELPGFTQENLSIYIDKHVLHISGKEMKEDHNGRHYLVRERRSTSFDRGFTLPEETDEEKVSAAFDKGILTLTVPKKAKEETKMISVTINK